MNAFERLSLSFVAVAVSVVTSGCAPGMLMARPEPPMPPRFEWQTVKDVVVTQVVLDSNPSPTLNIAKGQTIAIIDFGDAQGSGAGALVADAFILDLQRKGYKVVDRGHINKIVNEQGLMGKGATKASEMDIAKILGRISTYDYLLVGTVTSYSAENRDVFLNKLTSDKELERYEAQYQTYMQNCRTSQMLGMPCIGQVTPPQNYRDNDNRERRQLARIANVGLTAKLIELKTTNILWVGQTSVTDEKQQDGMRRIVEAMTKDFLKL